MVVRKEVWTGQSSDVHGRPCFLGQCGDVTCERWDSGRLKLPEQGHGSGSSPAQLDGGRTNAAVAHNHRGHTLRKLGQTWPELDHADIVMGVHVINPGASESPFSIDGQVSFLPEGPSDRVDSVMKEPTSRICGAAPVPSRC